MNIQELTITDQNLYKSFFTKGLEAHADCFRITPADEQKEPFPTQGNSDSFTLGAFSETDELLGVVSFEREGAKRQRLKHKGLLFRMYVSAEHGGKGIGKKLIEELLLRVKTQTDIEQINLTVVSTNHGAKNLYKKFGFQSFSVEINALKTNGTYYNEETMVLFLKEPSSLLEQLRNALKNLF